LLVEVVGKVAIQRPTTTSERALDPEFAVVTGEDIRSDGGKVSNVLGGCS